MEIETEMKLQDFRIHAKELFDKTGKRYTGTLLSDREAEMMLSLINHLEKELLATSKDEIKQKCLTILGEHIKGGHNNKSLIGKVLKSFKHNTTERTIFNAYNEIREAIKNI